MNVRYLREFLASDWCTDGACLIIADNFRFSFSFPIEDEVAKILETFSDQTVLDITHMDGITYVDITSGVRDF